MPKKATKKVEKVEVEEITTKDKKKKLSANVTPIIYKGVEDILEQERTLVSWSPAFDEATGGGILSGSSLNLSARPKAGKTQMYLQLASIFQRPENGGRYWSPKAAKERGETPGRHFFFYNVEGRLTIRDIESNKGINFDKFHWMGSDDQHTYFLEDYCVAIEQAIEKYPGCIIMIDSIGAMCTRRVADVTDGGQVRDNAPQLTSLFLSRIGGILNARDIVLLNILHEVTNTSGYGKHTLITGGVKIQFLANYQLRIAKTEPFDRAPGLILNIECASSEIGDPHTTSEGCLLFGKGSWNSYELLLLVADEDCGETFGVTRAKAHWTFDPVVTGEKEPLKIQGATAAAEWLDEHPEAYQRLYNAYAEAAWKNRKMYVNTNTGSQRSKLETKSSKSK